jgi:competence protein ComEC
MRKNTCYVIRLVAILLVISLRAVGQEEPKIPQVKIIHFGVGSADCTLIIVKDFDNKATNKGFHTITALIDTGQANQSQTQTTRPNDLTLWSRIWNRMRLERAERLDYFVISHLHEDHVGSATAILQAIEAQQYSWRREMIIIDRYAFRDVGIPVTYNNNTVVYRHWGTGTIVTDKTTGRKRASVPEDVINYDAYYRDHFNGTPYMTNIFGPQVRVTTPPQRRPIYFGRDLFRIGRDYELENVQMICVASNGVIGDQERTRRDADNRPRSENDLSFAFLLRFGSFRYFTGADLGGGGNYTNMERPLADQLAADWRDLNGDYPFHVCALKVNHHGSADSTNDRFVSFFNPQVAVFSADLTRFSGKRLPTEEAIRQLRRKDLLTVPTGDPLPLLLFTFRLFIHLGGSRGIIVDTDPVTHFLAYRDWENGGLQDVTLHVRRESDLTPLGTDKPPKIYMYKQPYITGTLTPDREEVPYSLDSIECKRLHNNQHRNLPLPSRN